LGRRRRHTSQEAIRLTSGHIRIHCIPHDPRTTGRQNPRQELLLYREGNVRGPRFPGRLRGLCHLRWELVWHKQENDLGSKEKGRLIVLDIEMNGVKQMKANPSIDARCVFI
ncbi:uncharacterized protein BO87DRAFT_438643, partial [Aspergillus neoniger CBS 115656]